MGSNPLIVKYTTSGEALWARTLTEGGPEAWFFDVAVDKRGNVYAAGFQQGSGTYGYGNSVIAAGTSASANVLLVLYGSSGTAYGARTLTEGLHASTFRSVAVDGSGRVCAAVYQTGTERYSYGPDVSATGPSMYSNAMLVMYR